MIESEIIVAFGSNTHPEEQTEQAKALLRKRFGLGTRFSSSLVTSPIGMGGPSFVNCIMTATTTLTLEQTLNVLKETERMCGDSRELRAEGKVMLDADLLLYGEGRHHTADWQRPYIKMLLEEMRASGTAMRCIDQGIERKL